MRKFNHFVSVTSATCYDAKIVHKFCTANIL
nr:MAG TPA: hypothetical protein [Caudoviricetes sp.]